MNSIFSFLNYKDYLRALSGESKVKGFQSQLALAAQCQRAYFSRVMNSEAHLTPEQAYGVASYLKLNEAEEDYFLELVNFARAGTKELKAKIKKRLLKIKSDSEDIKNRYKTATIADSAKAGVYYSSWHYAAIHIATGVENLQTPQAIARQLGVAEDLVESTLRTLEQFQLVTRNKDRWSYASGQIHLPRESMLTTMNHANWRHKALMGMENQRSEGLHYSVVHSHAGEDFENLKYLLLKTIDRAREIVDPSPNEQISCMTIDCFKL